MIPEIEKLEGFEKIKPTAHAIVPEKYTYLENPIYADYPLFEYIRAISFAMVDKALVWPRMKWDSNFEIFPDYSMKGIRLEPALCDVFAKRLIEKQIDTSFQQKYEENIDLQATLKGYGIDKDKFWYLLLFVKDFIDGLVDVDEEPVTAYRDLCEITHLLHRIDTRNISNNLINAELIIKIKGEEKKIYTNPLTLKALALCLYEKLDDMKERPKEFANRMHHLGFPNDSNDYSDEAHLTTSTKNISIKYHTHKQWLFDKYMGLFTSNYANQKKGKEQRIKMDGIPYKIGVSYEEDLLKSRLIYIINYTAELHEEEYNDTSSKFKSNKKEIKKDLHCRYVPMYNKHYANGLLSIE